MRPFAAVLIILVLVLSIPAAFAEEFDDCDANFIAFIGSNAYRFSPQHEGELGAVRLFSILSYQRAAHEARFGFAVWKLQIAPASGGAPVLTVNGHSRIAKEGAAVAELYWDGRDDAGKLVPPGHYRYTYVARYVADRAAFRRPLEYDWIEADQQDEALASTDEVVVDYSLTPVEAANLRMSAAASTACQRQQNTPMEAGFGYNFYYGSTHAHSNWSDGGQPTTNCSSANAYGSGTFAPADVFAMARDTAGMDFWVVNEHNHLIPDAIATNYGPLTEAKVKQRYQDGLAAANAATTSTFVGLYGMEWGVTSNADQGHVTLIETPTLFSWETCTTCNGPNPECTPGTDCYFDVFTPKRYNYLTMYARSVEHPSSAGPLGVFNHPASGNFDNFAFDANADNAIEGIAVRSGLAFSTATDCGTANIGATDYSVKWREALNVGFHLAPAADHDSHCNNFGLALPTRTVYLVPNGIAPALTKANLMAAHRARHFYATEDPNIQLVFRTSDSAHIMGDIFNAAGGVTLVANAYDPDGETFSTVELWRGTIGGGAPTTPYQTWSNTASVSFTESLTSGTYWYYAHVVQADGHDAWSAPMWITFGQGGGGDTTPPSTSITSPASGTTVTGTTLIAASASDDTGVARVEFVLDGAIASTDTTAPYEWSWDTTTVANGAHTLQSRAWDAAGNSASSASVSVNVSNSTPPPPSGVDVSGWALTQANSAYTYTLPAGTVVPSGGYVVVARSATQSAFETFWGRSLGSNVIFVNSNGAMPVINGDETYTLTRGDGTTDGPTAAMLTSASRSLQRTSPCAAASLTASWNVVAESSANPGSGAGAGCGAGVVINEFSDASGTGNYVYEFVELYNDTTASSGDTTAPTASITAPAAGSIVSGTTTVSASASDDTGVTKVEILLDGSVVTTITSAPYDWSWNTLASANGSHTLQAKAYDAANNVGSSSAVSVTVDNDTTAPSTSITAPSAGATVSGTQLVTASASDNKGVTKVEFYLDGALVSADTASPYEWSWNTVSSANGSHSLQSKAYDAAGNVGTSVAVSVSVNNVSGTAIGGWTITQANSTLTYTIPTGTTIPSRGYVIIARNADKASFQSFWGVTLGSNVVYINAADAMPQINGSETYTLKNAAGTKIDGATVAMGTSGGESLQRTNPCGAANKASSWKRVAESSATPGSGAPATCGKGVYIGEFSDASGTGNYVYEFIELQNDK